MALTLIEKVEGSSLRHSYLMVLGGMRVVPATRLAVRMSLALDCHQPVCYSRIG